MITNLWVWGTYFPKNNMRMGQTPAHSTSLPKTDKQFRRYEWLLYNYPSWPHSSHPFTSRFIQTSGNNHIIHLSHAINTWNIYTTYPPWNKLSSIRVDCQQYSRLSYIILVHLHMLASICILNLNIFKHKIMIIRHNHMHIYIYISFNQYSYSSYISTSTSQQLAKFWQKTTPTGRSPPIGLHVPQASTSSEQ